MISRLAATGIVAVAALLGMLCMGAVRYAQPRAQISGSVVDATGLPLVGATVALRGAADKSAQTTAEGRFNFWTFGTARYELTASFPGFATARRTARLEPAEKLDVSLTLAPLFLEHTVVTASKTGETDLQVTPMAVAVLNGRRSSRMQDHTVEDVVGRAPGVFFSQNTGLAQLTIRGIGTNAVFAGSRSKFGGVSGRRVPGASTPRSTATRSRARPWSRR